MSIIHNYHKFNYEQIGECEIKNKNSIYPEGGVQVASARLGNLAITLSLLTASGIESKKYIYIY